TRGSGPALEEAFARGIVEAGGNAFLAGVLPTPAVALLALDLGVVVSASHNPPEYNGIKIFDRDGRKLTDAAEEEIEALLEAEGPGGGKVDRVDVATDSYLEHIVERFGSDLSHLRVAVDCANGAYSAIAPKAFEQLGAEVTAVAAEPDGTNINLGCGATDLSLLQRTVLQGDFDLGVEQAGHIIYLKDHVTGDGLAAAMLLCAALRDRTLAKAAAVLSRYPQAKNNVRVGTKSLSDDLFAEIERINAELDGSGRILVRASGTEPVVRVLAEAENPWKAQELCARISALVTRELG